MALPKQGKLRRGRTHLLVVLLLLGVCSLTPALARAQASEPTPVDVLSIVRQARSVLQAEVNAEQADAKRKPVVVASKNVGLKVKLALWQENTSQLTYVTVVKGTGKVTSVERSSPYDVTLRRDNGVNSEFVVPGHPELHVAALKMPVFIDLGSARHPKWRLDNVVYTPYGDWLNTPAVVAAGEAYISSNLAAVYDELRSLGVTSRAFPGRSLADSIDPAVVRSILAIEHVNVTTLVRGSIAQYLNMFLATVAVNEHVAYAYARSSASATGLVQFIPSTYALVARRRADLGLNRSFTQAMTDPYNAIKAQVALLDINLTTLPAEVRQRYAGNNRELGALVAAMYNGGSTRVLRALKAWGSAWADDHSAEVAADKAAMGSATWEVKHFQRLLKGKVTTKQRASYQAQLAAAKAKVARATAAYATGSKANLKRETNLYVRKFYLLYDYLAQVPPTLATNANPPGEPIDAPAQPLQTPANVVH